MLRNEWDLPMVESMMRYWEKNPPLHKMVAAYLGVGGDKSQSADPDLMPVQALPAQEFDQMLLEAGLPVK